jgi:hypothetical protein
VKFSSMRGEIVLELNEDYRSIFRVHRSEWGCQNLLLVWRMSMSGGGVRS